MKFNGFWFLFLVVGTAFMFLSFSSSSSSSFPDIIFPGHMGVTVIPINRKLKEKINTLSFYKTKRNVDNMNLEDYHPVDPVPSSNAAIKAGPIQHSTPLMPYIPKPGPPSHP